MDSRAAALAARLTPHTRWERLNFKALIKHLFPRIASGHQVASTMWFDYTHALVRGLPKSFPESLKLHPPPEPIDMPKASAWHGLSGLLHSLTARRACSGPSAWLHWNPTLPLQLQTLRTGLSHV